MSVTRNGAVWSSMQRLLQGTALVLGLSAAFRCGGNVHRAGFPVYEQAG